MMWLFRKNSRPLPIPSFLFHLPQQHTKLHLVRIHQTSKLQALLSQRLPTFYSPPTVFHQHNGIPPRNEDRLLQGLRKAVIILE